MQLHDLAAATPAAPTRPAVAPATAPLTYAQALERLGLDRFMVATGIECSAPVIAGGVRQDQLIRTGHWYRAEEDIALVRELGIPFLRYGVPFHVVARDPEHLDWAWTDQAMAALRASGVEPIIDLLHFGLPDDLWGMADPRLADRYLPYVQAFAERYPWVRWYTPVNEPFITANFSARRGWWNERKTDDDSFVAALSNLLRLNLEAMALIRAARPDALFLQSDGCESFRALEDTSASVGTASFLTSLGHLGFDLTTGVRPDAGMTAWLAEHGLGEAALAWFAEHAVRDGLVIGLDFYGGNQHGVDADGVLVGEPNPPGFAAIARGYIDRYGLPAMVAETNHTDAGAVRWLNEMWSASAELAAADLPFVGFCWYSLTDQVDWDTCLREDNGTINSFGLVDLDRRMRVAGERYRELAAAVAADDPGTPPSVD